MAPYRVHCVWKVMAHAQKPHLVFQRNGRVHWNPRGRQIGRLLAAEVCASAGSDCIIFKKYVDHSLEMLLQGGKKRVKRSGERQIVYNVYKFTQTESELGITIPLSNVQKRVAETTCVSGRTLCRVLKLNSVALVRKRTIPTERPPPVGEVSANFCG